MTATATTALVPLQPAFSDAERLALAGFLARYRSLTREAYALDLRQFTAWCRARSLSLFASAGPTLSPSPGSWKPGPRPGDRYPAAVHHRRALPLRGRRRTPGPLTRRARSPPAGRLRV